MKVCNYAEVTYFYKESLLPEAVTKYQDFLGITH